MATQQQPSAHVVGNAFVHQYYHILHQSPELVYRFYQDTSKLGRPEGEGVMSSVTTMQAINEKILSLEYSKYKAEIKTVDAQESLDGGVLVLVTGYLTREDGLRRSFTQTFFLAPQDKGYFVLNDIFRYMEESEAEPQHESHDTSVGPEASVAPEQDAPPPQEHHVPEQPVPLIEDEEGLNVEEVYNPSDNEEGSVVDEETPVDEVVNEVPKNNSNIGAESGPAIVQEEAPKKSYASIVKVMKENVAPLSAPAPSAVKPVPANQEWQVNSVQTLASAPEVSVSNSNVANAWTAQEVEGDGHSIYIKNLPMNATSEQLEEEFKKFGPIKTEGIQVRSNKQQGFCFGFVQFEVATAVQSAIEASPVMIGGRQAYVEEKRPSGSRVSSRGRFAPGRGGGFRNDGMRGRGSYGGGRGYGRGDFINRAEFGNRGGGRGGGSMNRGDGHYQRVDSGSRANRPGGHDENATSNNAAPQVSASA